MTQGNPLVELLERTLEDGEEPVASGLFQAPDEPPARADPDRRRVEATASGR